MFNGARSFVQKEIQQCTLYEQKLYQGYYASRQQQQIIYIFAWGRCAARLRDAHIAIYKRKKEK